MTAICAPALEEYLLQMSRSRLQEIFLYWFPGRQVPAREPELRAMISSALGSRDTVYERFVRLTESQQNFLFSLAEFPEFAAVRSNPYWFQNSLQSARSVVALLQGTTGFVPDELSATHQKATFTFRIFG